ncbi:hypothetical protein Tco_0525767 [Tanacetum coccineum]
MDAIALTPCYPAFLITVDVPEVYMHQFWNSVHKHDNFYRFKLDKKKRFKLTLEVFRDIFQICPRVHGRDFDPLPSEEETVSFLRELGHTGEINSLNDVVVDQMHQPWRNFAALINRGLSGKTSGLDKLRLSRAQILWAKEATQIYRAVLPECLSSLEMKESKAYKAYLGYATGVVPPKMARKFKKAFPSKKDSGGGDDGSGGVDVAMVVAAGDDGDGAWGAWFSGSGRSSGEKQFWTWPKKVAEDGGSWVVAGDGHRKTFSTVAAGKRERERKVIMSSITAQQTKLDLELVPKENRLDIRKCNGRIPRGLTPREPTFQVVLDAIELTPCYPAFLITADVPEVYMHQFWNFVYKHDNFYRFKLDKKKRFKLTLEVFRDIFQICSRVQGRDIDPLPSKEDIVSFLRELGLTREINSLNDAVVDQMHQP